MRRPARDGCVPGRRARRSCGRPEERVRPRPACPPIVRASGRAVVAGNAATWMTAEATRWYISERSEPRTRATSGNQYAPTSGFGEFEACAQLRQCVRGDRRAGLRRDRASVRSGREGSRYGGPSGRERGGAVQHAQQPLEAVAHRSRGSPRSHPVSASMMPVRRSDQRRMRDRCTLSRRSSSRLGACASRQSIRASRAGRAAHAIGAR